MASNLMCVQFLGNRILTGSHPRPLLLLLLLLLQAVYVSGLPLHPTWLPVDGDSTPTEGRQLASSRHPDRALADPPLLMLLPLLLLPLLLLPLLLLLLLLLLPLLLTATTGMAVPHVSGAIALYASAYQRLLGSSPSLDNIRSAVLDQGTAAAAYAVSSRPGTIERAALSSSDWGVTRSVTIIRLHSTPSRVQAWFSSL
jgi:hypothetical protein